jgi:CRISPR-associated protein Cas1
MSLFAIQDQGARLTVRERTLVVLRGTHELMRRPLHEVTEVELFGAVEVTPAARALLLREGMDVSFHTLHGEYRGRLVGTNSSAAVRRRSQYLTLSDPERALALARRMVEGKLRNQRHLLMSVGRDHVDRRSPEALASLRQMVRRCATAESLDALRGMEGLGARLYFEGLARAVAYDDMRFRGRSRRPPLDGFNACLSFCYALLQRRVESAVLQVGLDPYLGALHDPGRGKPALVLDLMEEFRPLLVDRMILRLVNRRQLTPSDFEHPDADVTRVSQADGAELDDVRPAVYLGPTGRAIVIQEFAKVWRARVLCPRRQQRVAMNELVRGQVMQVAHWVENAQDDYQPYCPEK